MTPEEIMEKHKVSDSDLLNHWEAWRQITLFSSEKKLNAIPADKRKSIADFYSDMRKNGFYPDRARDSKIKFISCKVPVTPHEHFVERIPSEGCDFGKCGSCRVITHSDRSNCRTRTAEWLAGINNILSVSHRPQGEGAKLAEQQIDYMTNDFMGGVF
jgi:hypothetical protein